MKFQPSRYCFILTLLLSCFGVKSVISSEFEKGRQQVHISNLHEINDDYYVWTQNLTVDGTIKGDLVAGAYSIDVNGTVSGSSNLFANSITLGGTTNGSVRAFAGNVTIDGMVGGSAVAAAGTVGLQQGGVISREAHFFAEKVLVDGTVVGDLSAYGDEIVLSGTVEGDALLKGKTITVKAPAIIKGKLICRYSGSVEVDTAGGVILGNGVQTEKISDIEEDDEEQSVLTALVMKSSQVLAAFLIGIIALALMPGYTRESVLQLKSRFAKSAATGVLTVAITIIAFIFLIIALLCFAAGALLSSGSGAVLAALFLIIAFLILPISGIGAFAGAMIFYAGKIALAFLLGHLIARIFGKSEEAVQRWHLLVGLIALAALFALPMVGTLLYVTTCTIGAGAIVLAVIRIRSELLNRNDSAVTPKVL